MPISLSPEKMTPSTIAIYDLMCDGEWYENRMLIAYGAQLCAEQEREEALKNGGRVRRKSLASGNIIDEDALIDSGAKDMVRNRLMIAVRGARLERTKTHHRMTPDACLAWNAVRPARHDTTPHEITTREGAMVRTSHLSIVPTTPTHSPTDTLGDTLGDSPVEVVTSAVGTETPTLSIVTDETTPKTRKHKHTNTEHIFGGMSEADGWAEAPLVLRSRVHFRVENGEVPLTDFRAALPEGSDVAFDEGTGLYRVDCEHGTGNEVRDFIREWCAARDLKAKSLRAEHDVRRRNLNALNPYFLSDLCEWYARYSQGRVNKHRSTLQYHFTDKDDQDQQVYEWILEAVGRYDAESGVPFGAFLSERIGKWVHDLNRNKYGRIVSDTELKQQRAIAEFTTTHGRKPTEHEMAEVMGVSLDVYRKNAQVVSTVQGLRNIGTLDVAPGESEVHLPDEDMCDDRYNDELQQSMLSQVLTASCEVDPNGRGKLTSTPNVLGFVAWYDSLWGGKNKTELSTGLGTSMRNMNEYAARVETRMQERREDLIG